jgi:hypothetical protein
MGSRFGDMNKKEPWPKKNDSVRQPRIRDLRRVDLQAQAGMPVLLKDFL